VLGAPDLAVDSRFATHSDRKRNEDALDAEIDRLTGSRDALELARALQAAGVAAGPVAKAQDLFSDEQLVHRGLFRRLQHDILGDHAVINHSFRISGVAAGPFTAAPKLGEHTFEVAAGILGMSGDEIADLVSAGVLE
jgi:formyl-CoA transferase